MQNQSPRILVICDTQNVQRIHDYLTQYDCTYRDGLSKIREITKNQHFDYLVIFTELKGNEEEELLLKYISNQLPNIKSLCILKKADFRLSHFLGKNGITEVILITELASMTDKISKPNTQIKLATFGIECNNYPIQVQKTLKFIEENYLAIYTMSDVSKFIGITECFISHEFRKYGICPPKRLIMYFKVMHSRELLLNTTLKMKEIAQLSGFTNEQRYIECFQRMFNVSPGQFKRLKMEGYSITQKDVILN